MKKIIYTKNLFAGGLFTLANILTYIRIVLVPVYIWLFSFPRWEYRVTALMVFIAAAVTDLYDGRLARSRKEVTKIGRFLDPLADKFLIIGALAQFWMMGLVNGWMVAIIIIRDIWVTVMRVSAIIRGVELQTSKDAKLKTTIQLTVVISIIVFTCSRSILPSLGYSGPLIDPHGHRILNDFLVLVAAVFTVYSWANYIIRSKAA